VLRRCSDLGNSTEVHCNIVHYVGECLRRALIRREGLILISFSVGEEFSAFRLGEEVSAVGFGEEVWAVGFGEEVGAVRLWEEVSAFHSGE
jgi:hypothetical protein